MTQADRNACEVKTKRKRRRKGKWTREEQEAYRALARFEYEQIALLKIQGKLP